VTTPKPIDTLVSEIKAAAEAATPGPWMMSDRFDIVAKDDNSVTGQYGFELPEDADFAIACNPSNVLTLLAEIERLNLVRRQAIDAALEAQSQASSLSAKLVEREQEISYLKAKVRETDAHVAMLARERQEALSKLVESEAGLIRAVHLAEKAIKIAENDGDHDLGAYDRECSICVDLEALRGEVSGLHDEFECVERAAFEMDAAK